MQRNTSICVLEANRKLSEMYLPATAIVEKKQSCEHDKEIDKIFN